MRGRSGLAAPGSRQAKYFSLLKITVAEMRASANPKQL